MSQIHKITPLLESLFNKVADLMALWRYYKQTPTKAFSSEICGIFKNTCFKEHLQTTAFRRALQKAIYKTRKTGTGNGMWGMRGTWEMFTRIPGNLLDFIYLFIFSLFKVDFS